MLTLFIILILLYWVAEGCTEGYTWADSKRRMENKLIKGGAEGEGIIDYHVWRALEVLGIHGAILVILLSAFHKGWITAGVGAMLAGMFIYERCNMYVDQDKLFKDQGELFYIGGKKIPRHPWQDFLLLGTGIAFIIWGYLKVSV